MIVKSKGRNQKEIIIKEYLERMKTGEWRGEEWKGKKDSEKKKKKFFWKRLFPISPSSFSSLSARFIVKVKLGLHLAHCLHSF